MQGNIDWAAFRERSANRPIEAVNRAIALDELLAARKHRPPATPTWTRKLPRYAERTNRTPAAVRARLEKDGGLARLYTGLRREKTMEFLLVEGHGPQRVT